MITEPGVYDLSDEEYHGDPLQHFGGSLSSGGARKILTCPAKFEYERKNPPPAKKEFDLGHAAHALVLGTGPELVDMGTAAWASNAIKAEVAEVRARGGVPLKTDEYELVHEMAAALRAHPLAGELFAPGLGVAEQTLIWQDEQTGVWCRAKPDWWLDPYCCDYKTDRDAEPGGFTKAIQDHGYHIQGGFYWEGLLALGRAPADFLFIVQEKTAPYLVSVVRLQPSDLDAGRRLARAAMERYRDCTASGIWPGYSPDVETVTLSRYRLGRQLAAAGLV